METTSKKETILRTAAALADEKGFSCLTMKLLADALGIKPPSLYKHFSGGLEELSSELMLYGWRMLDSEITAAVIGRAKDDAVIALCSAYRRFVAAHRGLYEAMQWYNMYLSDAHLQATEHTVEIMFRALSSYSLTETQKVHTVRMLRAFLQGFCTIEAHGAYGNPAPPDDTFDFALKTILSGIAEMQKEADK